MKSRNSDKEFSSTVFLRHFNSFIVCCAIFLCGLAIGFFAGKPRPPKESGEASFYTVRLFANNKNLINPLLFSEHPPGGDKDLEKAKSDLQAYINTCLKDQKAAEISVYLRNLDEATWVGIDEDRRFTGASLVKVPLMIAHLKCAEQDPSYLEKKITYETTGDTNEQNIDAKRSLERGASYSINELMRKMIVYSDNPSSEVLLDHVDPGSLDKLFLRLKLFIQPPSQLEFQVSAKEFATLLRVLYNCTYLNDDMSQKALHLLADAEFHDGLAAGIPEGVIVAHKFGERAYPSGEKELHDCGIVYAPNVTYLICVMTKGYDFKDLKGVIQGLSKIAYDHLKDASNVVRLSNS